MTSQQDTNTGAPAYRSARALRSVLLGMVVLAGCGGPAVRREPIPVARNAATLNVARNPTRPAPPPPGGVPSATESGAVAAATTATTKAAKAAAATTPAAAATTAATPPAKPRAAAPKGAADAATPPAAGDPASKPPAPAKPGGDAAPGGVVAPGDAPTGKPPAGKAPAGKAKPAAAAAGVATPDDALGGKPKPGAAAGGVVAPGDAPAGKPEPGADPAAKPAAEPVVTPAADPVGKPKPRADSTAEPAAEPVAMPAADAAGKPKPGADSAAKPAAEPVADPAAESAATPAANAAAGAAGAATAPPAKPPGAAAAGDVPAGKPNRTPAAPGSVATPGDAPAGKPKQPAKAPGGAAPATSNAPAAAAAPGDAPSGKPKRAAAAAPAASTPAAADPARLAARRALAHLDLFEPTGQFRADEPLRRGVPLARGVLDDHTLLRAWHGGDGRALPIQTRPLSRWPDGSLRWVLVESRASVQSRGHTPVVVGLADDLPADPTRFALQRGADGSVVLTGAFGALPVLRPGPGGDRVGELTGVLVDRFGHRYVTRFDPASATLLEDGPLRAVVAVTGEHRTIDQDGLAIAFHTVTVHLHISPDSGTVSVEWTLDNGPLHEPPGPLAFRSYTLLIDGPGDVQEVELPGRRLAATSAVRHVQLEDRAALSVDGAPEQPPRDGDLWMGLRAGPTTLHVHRVESQQNHPAGLWWTPGGPLRVELLPALGEREYFLDDASRKTFRLDLVWAAGDAGSARMIRLAEPAHASLDPAEVAASGAWGDEGHLFVPTDAELKSSGPGRPRDAPTGWTDWGEAGARNTHQSGSPRNRLSVFLEAVQSRRVDLFRWAQSRAWHAMDLRPYHIQGFDASRFPQANLYEGTPHMNERPAIRLGRSEMPTRFPEYKQGLPEGGHGYNGFDPEHMTLDDVYECWLLTGSWPALSALRAAGEAMLTWKEVRPDGEIHSSRTFGWTLRALVQVWRATGERRYLAAARALVHRADAERGKGKVKWLRRMPPDARHIADRESDDPWMVAIALHGLAAYWIETADPIVPPMATDLSAFCLSAFRGNGFLPDVPVDGSPIPGEISSPLGVGSWVPGGLAAAAYVTDDHRPVDAVASYYAVLRARPDRPVSYGGRDWPWWQVWLASVEQRHGRAALADPASIGAR